MAKRRRHRRFSYAEERRLIQMAADLATMEEAAAAFGTTIETIERITERLGLTLKGRDGSKRLSPRLMDPES